MGFDYALVHLKYTIPPAIGLTLAYRPFLTRLDVYRILFLITIAVLSTTPWDSYLIRRRIWTYPPEVIIGPTLFAIPLEEVFFFVIQTYNTSLLYLLASIPTFHPAYLCCPRGDEETKGAISARLMGLYRSVGQVVIGLTIACGGIMVLQGTEATYLGLILIWAGPFILPLWSLACQFILCLPLSNTLAPIAIPTLYLWMVDTLALKRGTWVIEAGTKLGLHLWAGLEIEEAVFFLATNVLIVFGLIAFDNAIAILDAFPAQFPSVPSLPSPVMLVQALLVDKSAYESSRIEGFRHALQKLRSKSRSFYFASSFFHRRLRIDLVLLYFFCRVADDLVDDAPTIEDAAGNVQRLRQYLDVAYSSGNIAGRRRRVEQLASRHFPPEARHALLLLPTEYLPSSPLYSLLDGFETDLRFKSKATKLSDRWPISDTRDLRTYAAQVAGTVAELCLELILYHTTSDVPAELRRDLVDAGGRMGVALQHVNIARDIAVDARMNRVYLPTSWLKADGMTPEDILARPESAEAIQLRELVLDHADSLYGQARPAIDVLPREARAPMRVAIESYMEIGRILRGKVYKVRAGRATVPLLRRLRVGWRALSEG